jgi:hypothetical protein
MWQVGVTVCHDEENTVSAVWQSGWTVRPRLEVTSHFGHLGISGCLRTAHAYDLYSSREIGLALGRRGSSRCDVDPLRSLCEINTAKPYETDYPKL